MKLLSFALNTDKIGFLNQILFPYGGTDKNSIYCVFYTILYNCLKNKIVAKHNQCILLYSCNSIGPQNWATGFYSRF